MMCGIPASNLIRPHEIHFVLLGLDPYEAQLCTQSITPFIQFVSHPKWSLDFTHLSWKFWSLDFRRTHRNMCTPFALFYYTHFCTHLLNALLTLTYCTHFLVCGLLALRFTLLLNSFNILRSCTLLMHSFTNVLITLTTALLF